MRILIIGGTGFIGRPVLHNLLERGHEVMVLHRGTETLTPHERLQIVIGNRHELSSVGGQLKAFQPDVLIDMIPYFPQDVWSLLQLFQDNMPRIVAISSGDVYFAYDIFRGAESSAPQTGALLETSPLRRQLFPYRKDIHDVEDSEAFRKYNYDKILIEQLLLHHNTKHTILRLPMIYGPRDHRLRFSYFIKHFLDNRPFVLVQQSFEQWVWTKAHVENAAEAICLAVTNDRATGRIYNVGEDYQATEYAWIKHIAKLMNWQGEFVIVPDERLPDELKVPGNFAQNLEMDCTNIRQDLNYQDRIALDAALKDMIEYVSAELQHSSHDYTQEYQLAENIYSEHD